MIYNQDIKNCKGQILICATIKNEVSYLIEWIAYHRIIGIDHFLLYNNESTDNSYELLQSLEKEGIVTCINWPSNPNRSNTQRIAYMDAVQKLRHDDKFKDKFEWVAFLDLDEFILLKKDNCLKNFLSKYPDVAGIAINWKIFGSSGNLSKTDGLVIERFTRCSNPNYENNYCIKTLAKINLIKQIQVHTCFFFDSDLYVYPDKTIVPKNCAGRGNHITHELVQINHYFTKSKSEWDLKRSRGRATRKSDSQDYIRSEHFFYSHDQNQQEDREIFRFLDKTKQEINYLIKVAKLESIKGSIIGNNDQVEILKITLLSKYSPTQIVDSEITLPDLVSAVDPNSLKLQGWVLGRKQKVTAVQIISDGQVLKEIAVGQPHAKVAAIYPDINDAENCGYAGAISLIGLPTQADILVQSVFENKSCTPIGLIQYRKISNVSRAKKMTLDSSNLNEKYNLKKSPLMALSAINFLRNYLDKNSNSKVLEFGSGASTAWLSRFTSNLVSIEHHPDWYDQVKSTLSEDPTCQSVDLRLLPLPYYSVCDEFPDEYFDLIIVDGRDRIKCLEAAIRILKPGGVLMLDDAQRESYKKADCLLRDWEFSRAISPARQTHWWHKPLNFGVISSKWTDVLQTSQVRLYTGNLTNHAQQDGWIGISKVKSDESHIPHDWRKLLPIPDESVDAFLCEEFLKFIPPHQLLSVVFPELYRTLKPGGYIRMALPDYRCDVYLNRSLKDDKGYPYCDPEGGGKWDAEQQKITQGGLAWFPTYETLKSLIELSPLRSCRADWLHYYDTNGEAVMNEIDYSKGFIKRTPDHDKRVKNPRRSLSIIVDLHKDL